ncbi:hypothetical protein I5M27_13200 [Adhaeribacter sp. BT258]|uniref:Uncharacterized protein n=1 Tax=Adhaeribacter terrigena TaxID=2793070 RepID=A0ABS1C3G4_9BACT|nr:hypothetical protein [Adhaeribacter terrigena]MBK0403945.1 hypothetical protein [Adhaeribacter terrigena]
MTNKFSLKFLLQLLVIVAGIYLSWNLNVFIPFNASYPPLDTYKDFSGKVAPDTVIAAPGEHYLRGAMGAFWLGKHYRSVWAAQVKVPVLHISKKNGGMKILRKGGGMQTTSFTLADAAGTEYALRSVDKNPVHVLPGFFRYTFVASFVRDQVSATDPFAPQWVAELSSHAGVPYTTPELYFIHPEDSAFNKFGLQRGGFFNLSPKAPDLKELQLPGERFKELYSTAEMLQILTQSKGKASVDTVLFLRCRLFDLLIGDWDRHPGQWDWAGFSTENHTVFRPVPKDRDQAFGYYKDGVLPYLLTRKFILNKIASFTPEFEDVAGYSKNGRVLDDLLLKNVPGSVFQAQARLLQKQLPDAVLQAAIKKYPAGIVPETIQNRFQTLKSRRQQLGEGARLFYKIIQERNIN